MRIISGFLKGRRIKEMKKFHSRPTTDFAKEGLFNVLEHAYTLEGTEILDLFSGTGSISYEFISRGANFVYSVDSNFSAYLFVKKTSNQLNLTGECHAIIKSDAIKYLNKTEKKFDFIFSDPPFDYKEYPTLINTVQEKKILKPMGVLIVEHFKKIDLSNMNGYQKSHLFGNVCFSFFNFDTHE